MKKTYMKLFALAMMLVAATTASAQYTTELEDEMFKAWDSPDPGANEVPAEEAGTDEGPFTCVNGLYAEQGAGATIYGHFNVYYLWYADLTGTQTITFNGTPNVQLRILMNRPAPEEGGSDSHGGTTLERNVTIGSDGTATLDVSDLEYVHLNAIKTGWGSPSGKIRSIILNGSVQGSGKVHEPIEEISLGYQMDVVCVNLGDFTNLKDLMGNNNRLIFPKDCASVKVNGETSTLFSVEGAEGNKILIFINEPYPENTDDEVLVTFTNPTDAKYHLQFVEGRFEGADVPSFTDMIAPYQDEMEPYYTSLAQPELVSSNPENGSFNLPISLKTFELEFSTEVNCEKLEAMLDNEPLTVNPATGFAKKLTLTYEGGELRGVKELVLSNITSEFSEGFGIVGDTLLTFSFGPVVIDPNDQPMELLSPAAFDSCDEGGIPEGYVVYYQSEESPRSHGNTYGSGARMFASFSASGDFSHALYFREGYCQTENPLELMEGKKYTITFNSAQWKDNGRWMKFEILDEYGEPLYDDNENQIGRWMIDNQPNTNGDKNSAVNGSTFTSITFTPEYDGEYILRWTSSDANGTQGYSEVLLANVTMKYVPSTMGVEWMAMVQDAIDAAQKTLDDNSEERYQGVETETLQALINQYSDIMQFTSPGACQEATDALNAAVQAVKDHRANCDEYDTQVKKAIDIVRQNEMPDGDPNKATKFTKTELFKQLKDVVDKYHGTSEWVNLNEDPEGEPQWQLNYSYDVLTDDAALAVAIAELKDIVNLASLLFTEGVSSPENARGGKATGVAVLTDRLRLGAEALLSLGVPETSKFVVAAKNALTDDDELVEQLKEKLTARLYNTLNDPNNKLFEGEVDETTLEDITPTFDMTVFVKNPNTYKQQANMNFTEDNVPGWITPDGFNKPGLTVGWGQPKNVEGVAEDCMFQTWGGSYRVEQTIEDLPAGVYTVRFAFGERNSGDAGVYEDSYAYVTDSSGEEIQSPSRGVNDNQEEMFIPGIGQAFPFADEDAQAAVIEDVVVTDGHLTIGVNAGPSSHTFFNEVRILMTAPAPNFQYPKMDEPSDGGIEGDVNGDGTVDVADISAIISVMAGTAQYAAADVNGDGIVDVADISKVISIMAEMARRASMIIGGE